MFYKIIYFIVKIFIINIECILYYYISIYKNIVIYFIILLLFSLYLSFININYIIVQYLQKCVYKYIFIGICRCFMYIYVLLFIVLFILFGLYGVLFFLGRFFRSVIFKVMIIVRFMNKLLNVFIGRIKVYINVILLVG